METKYIASYLEFYIPIVHYVFIVIGHADSERASRVTASRGGLVIAQRIAHERT